MYYQHIVDEKHEEHYFPPKKFFKITIRKALTENTVLILLSGYWVGSKLLREICGKKYPMSSLLFLTWSIVLQMTGRKRIFGKISRSGRLVYFTFSHLYHLTSMRYLYVADVFVLFGSSPSLSFGFHRLLSDRDTTYVMAISLIMEFEIRSRRKDIHLWSPNPIGVCFSCSLFFRCLFNPSPSSKSVFSSTWKVEIPQKV